MFANVAATNVLQPDDRAFSDETKAYGSPGKPVVTGAVEFDHKVCSMGFFTFKL